MFSKKYRIQDTMALDECRGKPCFICHDPKSEVHHLRTRAAGGSDEAHNILPVCRVCHQIFHKKGISFVADKFDHFKTWLRENNWEWNELLKRWTHAG